MFAILVLKLILHQKICQPKWQWYLRTLISILV